METTWYSDFRELLLSPFKSGIPQIVESGSCMKGFYAAAAVSVGGSVLSTFVPAIIISIMQLHHTEFGRIIVMSANGGVAIQIAFNLFFTFLGLALNAYLVSWVANKFDAHTTPQNVLKVNWYSYAYGQLIALIWGLLITPVYILLFIYGFVRLGEPFDFYQPVLIFMVLSFLVLLVISLWNWWVSLNLLSQQIKKPKLSTFGISLLAGLIPFIIIMSLTVFIIYTVMSLRYPSGLF